MIGIIQIHYPNAIIVISSFFDLKNRPTISGINRDLKYLSNEQDLLFIDAENDLPRDQAMAHDYGHFSIEGASKIAELFAEAIIYKIQSCGNY